MILVARSSAFSGIALAFCKTAVTTTSSSSYVNLYVSESSEAYSSFTTVSLVISIYDSPSVVYEYVYTPSFSSKRVLLILVTMFPSIVARTYVYSELYFLYVLYVFNTLRTLATGALSTSSRTSTSSVKAGRSISVNEESISSPNSSTTDALTSTATPLVLYVIISSASDVILIQSVLSLE